MRKDSPSEDGRANCHRSVISRFFHGSIWPLLLRTDSAATLASCKRVLFVSFFKTFMLVLIAVTAIVTPLGLYEGIVAEQAEDHAAFHYIPDTSPMGYGTPPRTNMTFSRLCGWLGWILCPNDNNRATITNVSTGSMTINYTTKWYDSSIPQKVIDVFQSGVRDLGETVSGPFDIQYRTYIKTTVDDRKRANGPSVDNGTARTVGMYQPLSSLVLSDAILPVEGLVVDMKSGGIGFRNHSAPQFRPFGSTWSEDLLFVVPDTVCVDTNITLDFQIAATESEARLGRTMYKPELVDRGGYINLNTTCPFWTYEDPQVNPNLYFRAYRGAWLQNAFSMIYMNVTSKTNASLGTKAFAYKNTAFGKSFPLYYPNLETAIRTTAKPNSISFAPSWGYFLEGTEGKSNYSASLNKTYNFTSNDPIYSNPFNIVRQNWTEIGEWSWLSRSCFVHLLQSHLQQS